MYEHNPDLVHNLAQPLFDNISNRLLLANHSLKQLNIIDGTKSEGPMSSVLRFLNKCKTSMGIRKFNSIIMYPTIDEKYLNKEYDIVEYIKNNYDSFHDIRKSLGNIKDLEKLYRKIVLKKIVPCELAVLYSNIQTILAINAFVMTDSTMKGYLSMDVQKPCGILSEFLEKHLHLEIAAASMALEKNIFLKGIFDELDCVEELYQDSLSKMKCIRGFLSAMIRKNEPRCKEPIKIHETEKSGMYLMATKNRIRKSHLRNLPACKHIQYGGKRMAFNVSLLRFNAATGSNLRFGGEELNAIYVSITARKLELRKILRVAYKKFVALLMEHKDHIEKVITFITLVDVIITKGYVSKKYNYCKPQIDSKSEKSYIDATNLRHLLVEHIQTEEIYVPNDICLGRGVRGITLFGTNSVGKSCFIRSIGIAVILAQSGMFVPAERFVFKPYSAIFTRILGNDDIFKGLSTFAVEMSEFRTILRLADENSLILGDELCRGTETNSAISIFVAGLMMLHKRRSSFIFATHFHEIITMKEIMDLEHLSIKHMKVKYNREKNVLVFDRKLHDGGGTHMYGLEVCKSLNLPEDFLELALKIRTDDERKDTCKYNAHKIKNSCEVCGDNGEDYHHLQYQADADVNGFINHFHKNHVANLINICKKCHRKIHEANIRYEKKKTTEGIELLISNNNNI